uniref:leucine-rich repeat domain-containing protein n=1 Tax=Listeria farberi TaxID=2713500 RepID=UPI0021AB62B0
MQKTNVSTPVTQDELNVVGGIEVFVELSIASIEGVQYLNNLTELRLENVDNSVSDLRPLSGLIKLEFISFYHSQISDLSPLSGLISLVDLHLSVNQITDISALSDLTNLRSLDMDHNQIIDLSSLSNLTNLKRLSLVNNQISSITPLSGLINLTDLEIRINQVKDVSPLSSLANLEMLYVNSNQISDISSLKNLKNLVLFSAQSQTIVNKPVSYQKNLVLLNNIIDRTGTLVSPNGISDNGSYTSPDIIWNLPDYKKQVSYTFSIGDVESPFSGTVIQSLTEAPVSYKVVFDVEGAQTSETTAKDTFLTPPANPVKEGYTFTGWYDEKTGGIAWDFAMDKMPAKDITLYAQFSKNSSDGGTPGDKGQDGETGGKDGTTDKPTESDLQPVDKPTNNSPQLKDTQSTLSVKAKHVSGSKEQGAKEKSSLPATGDDSSFTLYLQATG